MSEFVIGLLCILLVGLSIMNYLTTKQNKESKKILKELHLTREQIRFITFKYNNPDNKNKKPSQM